MKILNLELHILSLELRSCQKQYQEICKTKSPTERNIILVLMVHNRNYPKICSFYLFIFKKLNYVLQFHMFICFLTDYVGPPIKRSQCLLPNSDDWGLNAHQRQSISHNEINRKQCNFSINVIVHSASNSVQNREKSFGNSYIQKQCWNEPKNSS